MIGALLGRYRAVIVALFGPLLVVFGRYWRYSGRYQAVIGIIGPLYCRNWAVILPLLGRYLPVIGVIRPLLALFRALSSRYWEVIGPLLALFA